MITDILVIGGGGAGARCAIECSDKRVVMAVKGLFGKSGCTVMAEGGYNAVLDPRDDFEKHFRDTLKGGCYINNPKLVKILVENAPKELRNLERFGALFDRREDGSIAQRPFGGQSFSRTCYSGDRTGHEIMTSLMEYTSKLENITVLEDVMAVKLIVKEKRCYGAIFLDLVEGRLFPIYATSTVLATGGAGQIYPITTNPLQKVGDGFALAYWEGVELIDMEMVQFHPTGMVNSGILVTEAVRGEGGILYNRYGERFMAKYDRERMELSTRDVVARAIYREIKEGRGIKGGVYLDVSHLGDEIIEERLETTLRQFLDIGVDIRREPMIVAPTAHHFMGGVRINERCETNIEGLFACGEVTGGIHGANRLGGNALADTQVFGAIAGRSAGEFVEDMGTLRDPVDVGGIINRIKRDLREKLGRERGYSIHSLIRDLKSTMWDKVSIVREERGLRSALSKIDLLKEHLEKVRLRGVFEVQRYFEFKSMLTVAELVTRCALERRESRGAHYRSDYPETREEWRGNLVVSREGIRFIRSSFEGN